MEAIYFHHHARHPFCWSDEGPISRCPLKDMKSRLQTAVDPSERTKLEGEILSRIEACDQRYQAHIAESLGEEAAA